ncbi:hypothetical protein GCM10007164_03770 [Luteimonas padinae]|nr:glycerophosphoryl diester phosphodiesterase membrane domain-containing protein [Luteimonas padinae]GHD65970.1 hypothetical protein GCM10007164_03770 [Luteimonas padinae]
MLAIGLLLHAMLYFRWLLATPALVLEGHSPLGALRRSRTLTRGRHLRIATLVAGVALTVAALPLAVTWLYQQAATPLLDWLPQHRLMLSLGMVAYLTLNAATLLGALLLGTTLNTLLVRALFHRLGGARGARVLDAMPHHPGRFVWGAEAAGSASTICRWMPVPSRMRAAAATGCRPGRSTIRCAWRATSTWAWTTSAPTCRNSRCGCGTNGRH